MDDFEKAMRLASLELYKSLSKEFNFYGLNPQAWSNLEKLYLIAKDAEKLRTENQRLREALEKIVNLDRFTKTDSSAYRMQVLAKEALAETEGE